MAKSDLSEHIKNLSDSRILSIDLLVTLIPKINVESASGVKEEVVLDHSAMEAYGLRRSPEGGVFQGKTPIHVLFEEFYLSGNVKTLDIDVHLVPDHYFHMAIKTVRYENTAFLDVSGRVNCGVADYRLSDQNDDSSQQMLDELKCYVSCIRESSGVTPSLILAHLGEYIPSERLDDFMVLCSDDDSILN